jgi:hypothetical protein
MASSMGISGGGSLRSRGARGGGRSTAPRRARARPPSSPWALVSSSRPEVGRGRDHAHALGERWGDAIAQRADRGALESALVRFAVAREPDIVRPAVVAHALRDVDARRLERRHRDGEVAPTRRRAKRPRRAVAARRDHDVTRVHVGIDRDREHVVGGQPQALAPRCVAARTRANELVDGRQEGERPAPVAPSVVAADVAGPERPDAARRRLGDEEERIALGARRRAAGSAHESSTNRRNPRASRCGTSGRTRSATRTAARARPPRLGAALVRPGRGSPRVRAARRPRDRAGGPARVPCPRARGSRTRRRRRSRRARARSRRRRRRTRGGPRGRPASAR